MCLQYKKKEVNMNKKIYDFERKYAIRDELLEMSSIE